MTNKEAIEVLNQQKYPYPEHYKDIEVNEALDLAIKALEEVEEWRKLTAVCAFDGYVIYKERTEANDADSN